MNTTFAQCRLLSKLRAAPLAKTEFALYLSSALVRLRKGGRFRLLLDREAEKDADKGREDGAAGLH